MNNKIEMQRNNVHASHGGNCSVFYSCFFYSVINKVQETLWLSLDAYRLTFALCLYRISGTDKSNLIECISVE